MHFLLSRSRVERLQTPRLVEDRSLRASAPVPGSEPGRDKHESRAQGDHDGTIARMSSPYDAIAELYDPWSASVVEDVAFYLEEARRSGGPGVELDLRVGDLLEPPVRERVPLVICPFRSLLHLHTDEDRRRALAAARELLVPGGRFVFDVFTPGAEDIAQTHDRWLEREPGIFERAVWDEEGRTLTLTVRGEAGETTMALAWLPPDEWRALLEVSGFEIEACYGWFDRRPFAGGEDTVWIARCP